MRARVTTSGPTRADRAGPPDEEAEFRRGRWSNPQVLLALGAVMVVYAVSWALVGVRGAWTIDDALKSRQAESIAAQGVHGFAFDPPGRRMDPDGRLDPVGLPFLWKMDGRLVPVFPPAFAAVTALPIRLLGGRGIVVVPLLSGLLLLLALARLSAETGAPRAAPLTVLLAGLTTPVWFYSLVTWEHLPAACLCAWSLVFFLRYRRDGRWRNPLLGGALAGASTWFRDELYIFCLITVALQFWNVSSPESRTREIKSRLRAVAVAALGAGGLLGLLWVFQWWTIGRPFGAHLATHLLGTKSLVSHLGQRPRVIYNLLLAIHPSQAVSLVFGLPLLAAFAWRVRPVSNPGTRSGGDRFGLILILFASAGALLTLSALTGSEGPIRALDRSNGLFAAVPVLALALFRTGGRHRDEDWLLAVLFLHLLLYSVLAPEMGSKGIHWGNRFLFLIYPLLMVPAARNLANLFGRSGDGAPASVPASVPTSVPTPGPQSSLSSRRMCRLLRIVAVIGLVVSLGGQVVSIDLLRRAKDFTRRLDQAAAASPEPVILTTQFWLPPLLSSSFSTREIYLARTDDEIRFFVERLETSGRNRFLYLAPRVEGMPEQVDFEIDDNGLQFYSVCGLVHELRPHP